MAGKTISFTIPNWTENLLANLLMVAGMAGACVMVSFLTDWRWGGLLGAVCMFVSGVAVAKPETPKVQAATPIRGKAAA